MTPEEVAVAALGVVSTYADNYPTTRAIMYRRISARQRELFVHIGGIDPEFYGADVVVDLDADDAADIGALEESGDVYPVESIQHVRVEGAGASDYATGDRVNLIPAGDEAAHLAPRATYRSNVIRGWGTDLDGVESLWVSYSRRPRTILPDGSGDIELLEPFQDLLIYDLVRDLIRRTIDIEGSAKTAALQMVEGQEAQLLESLDAHIKSAAAVRQRRHYG